MRDTDLKNIDREEGFIRNYLTNLDLAICLIEAHAYKRSAVDKLSYVLYYYPDICKLTQWQIAKLTGLARETVARNLTRAMELAAK